MEVGLIKQFERYCETRDIPEVYRILTDPKLSELTHPDLDSKGMAKLEVFGARGISVVLQSTSTRLAKNGFFEAHREFVDVHVPLIGVESIGYTPLDGRVKQGGPVPIYNLSKSDDVTYTPFESESEMTVIRLTEGMYALLDPDDVHMPRLQTQGPSSLVKMVIKIPVGFMPAANQQLRDILSLEGTVLEKLLNLG